MNGHLSKKFIAFVFTCIVYNLCFVASTFASNLEEKHVLIIHPFTPEHPVHMEYNVGLIDTLKQHPNTRFTYSSEYLDFARHSHEKGYFDNIAQYLKLKYQNNQPDFIVTQGNLRPMMEQYRDTIFPNVPVIFAWNSKGIPMFDENKQYYYVVQLTDVVKNIDLVLQTRPGTKKIYIIIGDSEDERNFVTTLTEITTNYVGKVGFVYLNQLPFQNMLEAVSTADEDSAILYFRYLADVNGNSYTPEEVIDRIVEIANVPVYGSAIQFLGSGMLGGFVRDQQLAGSGAANTIIQLLEKEIPASELISQEVANVYAFDWRQLKRWKIDTKDLPENSVIKFKELSVWEQYWGYILSGFVVIIVQTFLILGLLISRRQRKNAESELRESNDSLQKMTERLIDLHKMKDEFLTNTSHELQTPLNGIINITEAIIEEKFGKLSYKQKEELRIILAVSKRLSTLVKDIIDLEKIKRDEIQMNLKIVNIKSVSLVVTEVINYLIQDKDINIVIDIPGEFSYVVADEDRLIQVLYNLIGNSVKFTSKGTVSISANEENNYIKLRITDDGIGITKAGQKQLFKAFTHADDDIQRQFGGSGLGLNISKKLLESMKGSIALEWSEVGKGTCFAIMLPKADKKIVDIETTRVDLEKEDDIETNEATKLPIYKILAVDDEFTNVRVLKSLLTGDGYEVITATSGQEAIETLYQSPDIDLVLMDVMMPGMSGYEACRKIRENFSLYDLPLLIVTARNTPEDIVASFESGANDFVVKPFIAQELRVRIATLLTMKHSVQDALKNEIAFLQAQIKPHFLYNALSTIMSFCYTNGPRAGELLGSLSEYLRKSFDIDKTMATVSLGSELELTKAYVDIEKARFGNRLQVEFHIDETLLMKHILPLSIQPVVENAIRHGIMKRKNGGTVKVIVIKENDDLLIRIEDDGIGMENIEEILQLGKVSRDGNRSGVGLINIKQRLIKCFGTELIVNSHVEEGTKVFFRIPFK